MPLFRPKPRAVLPPNAAAHLAEYGRFNFDPQQDQAPGWPTVEFTMFVSKLSLPPISDQQERAVEELHELGVTHGWWVAYGACEAVYAFFPSYQDSARARDLLDARLRFKRGLGLPNIRMHLNTWEYIRFRELFPGEFD